MNIYQQLQCVIHAAFSTLDEAVSADLSSHEVHLETPKDKSHGDFATNQALALAKKLRKNPRDVANAILPLIQEADIVEKAEVAGPGFINISLTSKAWQGELNTIYAEGGEAYGCSTLHANEKAIVEYVSINPTGPIHVGHGRNAVFGDVLANILERIGYNVYREYLMNDAGGQIRVLVNSLHARYRQLFGEDASIPEGGYPGEYLVTIAEQLKAKDGDKWLSLKTEDELYDNLRTFVVDAIMNIIKQDIDTLHINFDNYFSEFAMHKAGNPLAAAVEELRAKGYVYKGVLPPPKGKEVEDYEPVELTLFKATAFGLPEDQAIYNRQGRPTYFGQDIAYHKNKLERGFNYQVTVLGMDQVGAAKPLEKAMEAMTGKQSVYNPVFYEMVKVLRNGKPVRMSKRAGNFVLLKDVLEEVGADAFRFLMLCYKPTTIIEFDLVKAVEQSLDNPVYYVQYAHARMCALLRQAKEQGVDITPETIAKADTTLLEAEDMALVKQLSHYPHVIERAAMALEPHRLAFYMQDLAASFHSWYNNQRVINPHNVALTHARLKVVIAARNIMADALHLMGVTAPEKM